jgi:dual 3',5'-cyclic-AMP and -GMP phosphodiesterase 11
METIRFPATSGVAGYVATSGEVSERANMLPPVSADPNAHPTNATNHPPTTPPPQTLNIPDAYADERFNRAIDDKTGFKTRNILCMPVPNAEHKVIAVAQLVNKRGDASFTQDDEQAFGVFTAYCGMALHNASLLDQLRKDAARRQVALEMISYHTAAHPREVEDLKRKPVSEALANDVRSITYDPLRIDGDETLVACKAMFIDSGLAREFRISQDKLCAWLISVRRNYRDVRYHNWKHAFNVGQFIYGIMETATLHDKFTPLERLGFIIAALSHDLDHRGRNNAFETKYATALGGLYTTSTLEHHHFDRCLAILNAEGHNILGQLNSKQYDEIVHFIEASILATDLGKHFSQRKRYKDMLESGTFALEVPEHRALLRDVLMTAADLSAVTKPFPAQRRTAELVYAEFFDQGDLERALGTQELQDLMNRNKVADLPKMQIGFIDFVAGPVYETLGAHFEEFAILTQEAKRNKRDWEALAEKGSYEFVTPLSVLTSKTKSDALTSERTIAVDEV